ncbi:hypothetical protein GCM10009854_15130 [Saccharopolyspora halophila]|uniref:Uncharacterized protein n=2 Tax=Saccharopolyspora halophila TaxID=405551 RepID=A0ABN3FXK0_9PSEU
MIRGAREAYDVSMNEASRSSAPPTPTTTNQDVLAASLAALMPLGGGLLLVLGYVWVGAFGAVLAAAGVAGWAYWWYGKNQQRWFPADLRGGQVGGIAVLVAVITLLLFLSIS